MFINFSDSHWHIHIFNLLKLFSRLISKEESDVCSGVDFPRREWIVINDSWQFFFYSIYNKMFTKTLMYKQNIVDPCEDGRYFEIIWGQEMKVRIEGIINIPILDLILNFRWQNIHYFIIRELGKWYFYFFISMSKYYEFKKYNWYIKQFQNLMESILFSRLQLPGHENANNKCAHIKYGQIIAEDCRSSGYCICKKTIYSD